MTGSLDLPVDLRALEAAAAARIDPIAYAYVAGGVGREHTVRDNELAWEAWRLRPRMLRDVSSVSTATTLLGAPVASPVVVAPTAMHAWVHPERELATAAGAASAGSLYTLSMAATTDLADVAAVAPDAPRWMQVYVQRDRGVARAVCERARDAGYRAIVLTVDSPVTTRHARVDPGNFSVPPGLTLPNFAATGGAADDLFGLVADYDPGLSLDDISAIRAWSGLPLVVKGVLRGDDALACLAAGADAIAVSNHGGRMVDSTVPTAYALADVVDAVGDRAEVYVDGGLRDAPSVLKALALGARAVLVGRPVVWGLAVGGAAGVAAVLETLRTELARTMALCGVRALDEIGADLLVPFTPAAPARPA